MLGIFLRYCAKHEYTNTDAALWGTIYQYRISLDISAKGTHKFDNYKPDRFDDYLSSVIPNYNPYRYMKNYNNSILLIS